MLDLLQCNNSILTELLDGIGLTSVEKILKILHTSFKGAFLLPETRDGYIECNFLVSSRRCKQSRCHDHDMYNCVLQ